MRDIFVVHHSVFHDAFRTDYETSFRDSSKNFFDLLLKHWVKKKRKIAFTSHEVFSKLYNSALKETKTFWIIHEYLCEIDFSGTNSDLKLDQSVVRLASKKCVEFCPYIVSTKPKDKIDLEGTTFMVLTPKEAIEIYNHENSKF